MNILVLGGSGYVGNALIPRLLEDHHSVRSMSRSGSADLPEIVRVHQGNILEKDSCREAFDNIDVVYYLIHSMASGKGKFESLDRTAAQNTADLAREAGVKRIIYLGGLGEKSEKQSPHLRSRHEVGDILRSSDIPVTEFRAAILVGSGSISFEMIHHLVNRLPLMICPRWVNINTQPIATSDAIEYLATCLDYESTAGEIIDIGGPDILTYREMMLTVARVLGLRRYLIQVPVLTPRLSSYWVNFVTPINTAVAQSLIESLRSETVCHNTKADDVFPIQPMSFEQAVRHALHNFTLRSGDAWPRGSEYPEPFETDKSHLLTDTRTLDAAVPASQLFSVVEAIGGERGWYFADSLWTIRGFIDKLLGGIGMRRGRPDPISMHKGDKVDFWEVIDVQPGTRILLFAEMKAFGTAWLEFRVRSGDGKNSTLTQTAYFYPKGLTGHVYWYGIYPIHVIVFKGMAQAIVKYALRYTRGAGSRERKV